MRPSWPLCSVQALSSLREATHMARVLCCPQSVSLVQTHPASPHPHLVVDQSGRPGNVAAPEPDELSAQQGGGCRSPSQQGWEAALGFELGLSSGEKRAGPVVSSGEKRAGPVVSCRLVPWGCPSLSCARDL